MRIVRGRRNVCVQKEKDTDYKSLQKKRKQEYKANFDIVKQFHKNVKAGPIYIYVPVVINFGTEKVLE